MMRSTQRRSADDLSYWEDKLYQMDLNRVKFLLSDYLRTRRRKVQPPRLACWVEGACFHTALRRSTSSHCTCSRTTSCGSACRRPRRRGATVRGRPRHAPAQLGAALPARTLPAPDTADGRH